MTTKQAIIFGVSIFVAAGAGFAGGYFVGKHKVKKETDDIISQLNDEVNYLVSALHDRDIYEQNEGYEERDYSSIPLDSSEDYYRAKEIARKNDELKAQYWETIKREKYAPISDEAKQKIIDEVNNMSEEEKDRLRYVDEDEEERIRHNEEMGYETDEHYEERHGDEIDVVVDSALESGLPPYIIDENDYTDPQFSGFTKQQFTYFGDGTLIDDGDEIVPNEEDLVGVDNLIELETGNTDRIFVRNEKFAADYEIIFKEMTYNEFMGMVEE